MIANYGYHFWEEMSPGKQHTHRNKRVPQTHSQANSGCSAFSASPEVVLNSCYHSYHGNKLPLFACYRRIKDLKSSSRAYSIDHLHTIFQSHKWVAAFNAPYSFPSFKKTSAKLKVLENRNKYLGSEEIEWKHKNVKIQHSATIKELVGLPSWC